MNGKLTIAVMGSATLPIPPFQGYGGTQRGIYDFIKNMNRKGHRIHLFGPGDSEVSDLENVVLHSFVDQSLWVPENGLPVETKLRQAQEHYDGSLERLREIDDEEGVDVINLRKDDLPFILKVVERFGPERVVYSLHNVKDQARIDVVRNLEIACVAHCRSHREQHDNLPNIRVIMYGIDTEAYPFSADTLSSASEDPQLDVLRNLKERGLDYVVTLGAIGKHKGQRTSIELSRQAGIPLIIAGEPQDRTGNEKRKYFEDGVAPYVDGENVIYFGNADEEEKKLLLKYARGFLFPSGYEDRTWTEPFGRAPVEALACGTPVVAYRKGSMEEVIFDSFNGFLFESSTEAVSQIKHLNQINRADCRRIATVKFDGKRVSDEYEGLFYSLRANGEYRG